MITKLALIGLLLLTTAVYFPPFHNYWVGDDYVQLGYVADLLSQPWQAMQVFLPTWTQWYYRPLQNLWFLAGRLLFGVNPLPYYAIQLSLHALAVALMWRVARQAGLRPFLAFVVAALFAVHGHYVDVVSWVSAIAIVLMAIVSLLTVSVWLTYLERPSRRRLLLTLLLCLLALTIHEETIILPPFLALLLFAKRARRPFTVPHSPFTIYRSEIAAFATLALALVAYLIIQLTRPNATIDLTATAPGEWVAALAPQAIAEFWATTLYKLTFLLPATAVIGVRGTVIGVSFLLILLIWFWQGNGRIRLGLIWFGLHLAFIYLALWTQKPALYAGRHLYVALPGLFLAVGIGVEPLLVTPRRRDNVRRAIAAGVVAAAVIGYHISIAHTVQQEWLADTQTDAAAMQQLQQLLPEVTPEMHIFAYRFPVTPQFLRSMIHVWYDVPLPPWPSGSLDALADHGEATDDFYLFDYENGVVTNLLPELQAHTRTIFLWAQPATVRQGQDVQQRERLSLTLTGPADARRLGVGITVPQEQAVWHTLTFATAAPPNSSLHVELRNHPGLHYRIVQTTAAGNDVLLYETITQETAVPWLDVRIPLQNETETGILLKLEVRAANGSAPSETVWSNPRLVQE